MNIGSLAAKLTAYDAGFGSTLAKAQRQVSTFSKAVSNIGSGIGIGIGVGIVNAVSAIPGQIAGVVTGQMEAIDKAAKASDTLGTATEKLLGLGYAGDLAGASMEDLTGSLSKMTRNLGEAISGSATAKAAFASLGLDVGKLAGMDSIDAMGQIGDALNKLPNPAMRTAAAMDIFGKGAASIIPLLASGSEGIAAATKEAEAFGLAINRVDAAKVEQANDAMTRVKSAIMGLGTTLAVQLSPWITKIADGFVEWATRGGNATKFIVDALEWVVLAVVRVGEAVDGFRAAWYYLKGGVIFVAQSIIHLIEQIIVTTIDALDSIGLATDGMKDFAKAATEVYEGMAIQSQEAFDEAGKIMDAIGSDASATRVKRWFADARKSAEDFGKAVAAAKPANNGAVDVIGAENILKVRDIIGKLSADLADLTVTPLQKVINSLKEAGASVTDIAKATDLFNQINLTKFSNTVLEALKTPAEAFREMIDQLSNAVVAGLLTSDQAAAFATSKIVGGERAEPPPSAGLILANSAQAQLFQFSAGKKPVEDQQLAAQKQMVATLKQIEKNTDFADDGDYSGL